MIRPDKMTVKTQEALAAAQENASARSAGTIEPEHLLLALLDELLRALLPVGIEDVPAVDRRHRRGRGDRGAPQQAGGLHEQETANERHRENPEDELRGAPHCLEHGQNSFSDENFEREGKLEKLFGESG